MLLKDKLVFIDTITCTDLLLTYFNHVKLNDGQCNLDITNE